MYLCIHSFLHTICYQSLEAFSPSLFNGRNVQELLQACFALQQHSDEQLVRYITEQASMASEVEARQYLPTLRLLLHSGSYLQQQLLPETGELAPATVSGKTDTADQLALLSAREWEVLQLLAQSYTLPQIGERLFISPATVNNHCARMREKLGLKGRNALLRFAISSKEEKS